MKRKLARLVSGLLVAAMTFSMPVSVMAEEAAVFETEAPEAAAAEIAVETEEAAAETIAEIDETETEVISEASVSETEEETEAVSESETEIIIEEETVSEEMIEEAEENFAIDSALNEEETETACEHTAKAYDDIAATLFTSGKKGGSYCTKCGEELSSPQVISALDLSSVISLGSTGDEVKAVQLRLQELGYSGLEADGYFGNYSVGAVSAFQIMNGLSNPDGKVGNWTLNVMRNTPKAFKNLTVGSNGNAVLAIQKKLKELGYLAAAPDGVFGNASKAAVKSFQLLNGLPTTGTADLNTVIMIFGGTAVYLRTLSEGMTGNDVTWVQQTLKDLGYYFDGVDGQYGGNTVKAAKVFQGMNGIVNPDGMIGRLSYSILADSPLPFTELKAGSYGDTVLYFQKILAAKGLLTATPDGIFGGKSTKAVQDFQRVNKLNITGTINYETALALLDVNSKGVQPMSFTDYGDDVYNMQQLLHKLGYLTATPDGFFGSMTYAALYAFQAACGVSYPDAQYGDWTRAMLTSAKNSFKPVTSASGQSEIFAMQFKLAVYGLLGGADGIFGPDTESALRYFQSACGLPVTGVGDIATLSALYGYYPAGNFDQYIQGFTSDTDWLITVDTYNNYVRIYSGSQWQWKLYTTIRCSSGAYGTETVKGVFSITANRGYSFGEPSYSCYWYSGFCGAYLFHSVLYNAYSSVIQDGRLGMNISHGCVRLAYDHAKWIYDNIPIGTTVYVY